MPVADRHARFDYSEATLLPGPVRKFGEEGLVSTVCARAKFPDIPGIPDNTVLPPRGVMSVCVFCRIFNRTLLTMAICIENVLCYLCARSGFCRLVCLPATSRQSDGTKTRQ